MPVKMVLLFRKPQLKVYSFRLDAVPWGIRRRPEFLHNYKTFLSLWKIIVVPESKFEWVLLNQFCFFFSMLQTVLMTPYFYFSYTSDLTNSRQRAWDQVKEWGPANNGRVRSIKSCIKISSETER